VHSSTSMPWVLGIRMVYFASMEQESTSGKEMSRQSSHLLECVMKRSPWTRTHGTMHRQILGRAS
jgi:hypothetical protein